MELTTYGLLCALALLLMFASAGVYGRRHGVDYGTLVRLAVVSIPLAWLCARLTYVAASLFYYLDDVEDLSLALHFWDGGYSMLGVYFGLVLGCVLASGWTKIKPGMLLDALAMGMPVGLIAARLAERGTGLGEGAEVSEGWPAWLSIETEYGTLLSVFLLEALAAAAILLILLLWLRFVKNRESGDVMLMFTLLFGCTQVLLESFRSDGHMEIHMGVHIQQVLAAALILAVIAVWSHRAQKRGKLPRWWRIPNGLLAIALVALAVVAEFGVDRWDSKLAAYGLMVACLISLAALAIFNRRKANA